MLLSLTSRYIDGVRQRSAFDRKPRRDTTHQFQIGPVGAQTDGPGITWTSGY